MGSREFENRANPASRDIAGATDIQIARQQLGDRPRRATSAGRLWKGIWLDEYGTCHVNDHPLMPPRDHHVALVTTANSPHMRQERLGTVFKSPVNPGTTILIPAGYESTFSGIIPAHLRIGLAPELLLELADEFRRAGTRIIADVSNHFTLRDETLHHAASILSLELSRSPHPVQDILVETIANALTLHLLRHYSSATEILDRRSGDASQSAIRRALDYIEDSYDLRISLAELASTAGLSRFHFSRLFKQQIGISPAHYLEKARIEKAKRLLRSREFSVADVAQQVGFADQSHFTRRFKRHVGLTPAAYAREHGQIRLPPLLGTE